VIFIGGLLVVAAIVAGVLLLSGDEEEGGESAVAGCDAVAEPPPKDVSLDPPQAEEPTAGAIVFDTSCGEFTVALDQRSPKTAASMQYLAEEGVYDGTTFTRVAPGFVIQGGDPTNTGGGDPGYTITEPPPPSTVYRRGLVAMAKSGAEPPGTSGSQFFVITAPADAGLPPDYAVAGEVTDGFDTIGRIESLATSGDGPPSQPVVIESATVVDSATTEE
jgi:cyclophilin family peptidyl-prolyl cis-trans isomerase